MIKIPLSCFILLAVGCGSRSPTSILADDAENVTLQNGDCRVFIEKASATIEPHWIKEINFFLKTRNGFDSAIDKIYFHGVASVDGQVSPRWVDMEIRPYLNAGDYWQGQINVTMHNNSGQHLNWVKGAFFVKTVQGTKYWLKARNPSDWTQQEDFVFNSEMYENMRHAMIFTGIPPEPTFEFGSEAYRTVSPDRALWTKRSFPYLNPNGCE